MPDLSLSQLTEESSPESDDYVEVLVDGVSRKVQLANLGTGGGAGTEIEDTDGSWNANVATSASDGDDEAFVTIVAEGGSPGATTVTVISNDSVTGFSVAAGAGAGFAVQNDGSVKVGFFGGTPAVQQSFDSGDTDSNRIAALEAIVAAFSLAVDTA